MIAVARQVLAVGVVVAMILASSGSLSEWMSAAGAAVLDEHGAIHAGCNVENAAYPQGWCAETTALGAAYLAGLAVGTYKSLDELAAQWQVERRFQPTLPRERAAELMAKWERAVRQTVAA